MKYSDFSLDNEMVDTGKGYKVKTHLTANEIVTIAQNMLAEKNYMTRQKVKGILLVHFCTDIEVEFDKKKIVVENDVYDRLNQNGVIETVENTVNERDLWMIDDYISYEESTIKVVEELCTTINANIDKYANQINVEDMVNTLKELERR